MVVELNDDRGILKWDRLPLLNRPRTVVVRIYLRGGLEYLRIPVDLGTRSARDLGGRSGPLGRIGAERRVKCVRGGRCGGGLMNRWVMEFSGWRWA